MADPNRLPKLLVALVALVFLGVDAEVDRFQNADVVVPEQIFTQSSSTEPSITQPPSGVILSHACHPGSECVYSVDAEHTMFMENPDAAPTRPRSSHIKYTVLVTPHSSATSLDGTRTTAWSVQGRSLLSADQASHSGHAKLEKQFRQCEVVLVQQHGSGHLHAKLAHAAAKCEPWATDLLMGAADRLVSVKGHTEHTKFRHTSELAEDRVSTVGSGQNSLLARSVRNHKLKDDAVTDEASLLQSGSVRSREATSSVFVKGKSNMLRQKTHATVFVGKSTEGAPKAHPTDFRLSFRLHHKVQHTLKLQSMRRAVPTQGSTSAPVDGPTLAQQYIKGGMRHYKLKKVPKKDETAHIADAKLVDHDYLISLFEGKGDPRDLASLTHDLMASKRIRRAVTSHITLGRVKDRKITGRLLQGLGSHLPEFESEQEQQEGVDSLLQVASSPVVGGHTRHQALVALAQPTCYNHMLAIQAIDKAVDAGKIVDLGDGGSFALHLKHGLISHAQRCTQGAMNDQLQQHARLAQVEFLEAVKGKDWDEASRYLYALENSKLHSSKRVVLAAQAHSLPADLQTRTEQLIEELGKSRGKMTDGEDVVVKDYKGRSEPAKSAMEQAKERLDEINARNAGREKQIDAAAKAAREASDKMTEKEKADAAKNTGKATAKGSFSWPSVAGEPIFHAPKNADGKGVDFKITANVVLDLVPIESGNTLETKTTERATDAFEYQYGDQSTNKAETQAAKPKGADDPKLKKVLRNMVNGNIAAKLNVFGHLYIIASAKWQPMQMFFPDPARVKDPKNPTKKERFKAMFTINLLGITLFPNSLSGAAHTPSDLMNKAKKEFFDPGSTENGGKKMPVAAGLLTTLFPNLLPATVNGVCKTDLNWPMLNFELKWEATFFKFTQRFMVSVVPMSISLELGGNLGTTIKMDRGNPKTTIKKSGVDCKGAWTLQVAPFVEGFLKIYGGVDAGIIAAGVGCRLSLVKISFNLDLDFGLDKSITNYCFSFNVIISALGGNFFVYLETILSGRDEFVIWQWAPPLILPIPGRDSDGYPNLATCGPKPTKGKELLETTSSSFQGVIDSFEKTLNSVDADKICICEIQDSSGTIMEHLQSMRVLGLNHIPDVGGDIWRKTATLKCRGPCEKIEVKQYRAGQCSAVGTTNLGGGEKSINVDKVDGNAGLCGLKLFAQESKENKKPKYCHQVDSCEDCSNPSLGIQEGKCHWLETGWYIESAKDEAGEATGLAGDTKRQCVSEQYLDDKVPAWSSTPGYDRCGVKCGAAQLGDQEVSLWHSVNEDGSPTDQEWFPQKNTKCRFKIVQGFVDGKDSTFYNDGKEAFTTMEDAKKVCAKLMTTKDGPEHACGGVMKSGGLIRMCQPKKATKRMIRFNHGAEIPPRKKCLQLPSQLGAAVLVADCDEGNQEQIFEDFQTWTDADRSLNGLEVVGNELKRKSGPGYGSQWELAFPPSQEILSDPVPKYESFTQLKSKTNNKCLAHQANSAAVSMVDCDLQSKYQWFDIHEMGSTWEGATGSNIEMRTPQPVGKPAERADFVIKQKDKSCFLSGDFTVDPSGHLDHTGYMLVNTRKDQGRYLVGTLNTDRTMISWDTMPITHWRQRGAVFVTYSDGDDTGGGCTGSKPDCSACKCTSTRQQKSTELDWPLKENTCGGSDRAFKLDKQQAGWGEHPVPSRGNAPFAKCPHKGWYWKKQVTSGNFLACGCTQAIRCQDVGKQAAAAGVPKLNLPVMCNGVSACEYQQDECLPKISQISITTDVNRVAQCKDNKYECPACDVVCRT